MEQTTTEMAREYERRLRLQIWQWENVDDDWVTEPVIEYSLAWRKPVCIEPEKVRSKTEGLGAYHVVLVIGDDSNIDKIILDPECVVDLDL